MGQEVQGIDRYRTEAGLKGDKEGSSLGVGRGMGSGRGPSPPVVGNITGLNHASLYLFLVLLGRLVMLVRSHLTNKHWGWPRQRGQAWEGSLRGSLV